MLAVALLTAGGLWVRDSSLVAVEHVKITGASGLDGPAIRRALSAAARDMTTLHVRQAALRDAVASYPVVKALRVSAHPLHELTIEVVEYNPAAVLSAGERRVPVAADGTILPKARQDGLPLVPARTLPGGNRLRERQALGAVALAGAAPAGLRGLIVRIRSGGRDGLRADLQGGVRIVFGARDRLAAKWTAAARVLADPKAAGAAYVDVRVPERPVAGPFTETAGAAATRDQSAPAGAEANLAQLAHPAGQPGANAAGSGDSTPAGAGGGDTSATGQNPYSNP
jgi:cell division protein FtsQ